MAKFGIKRARQELGFTPSTAVRANIDTRTGAGEVGAAIGQAGLAVAGTIQKIQKRRQDMEDTRSGVEANSLINTAVNENTAFRGTTTDTKAWAKDLQERLAKVEAGIGALPMSDNARALIGARFQAASTEATSRSLIAETSTEASQTRESLILDLTEAVRSGSEQDKLDASGRFDVGSVGLWTSIKAKNVKSLAIQAGQTGRSKDAVSAVHAAVEAASVPGGDFAFARELATNPDIPEPQQTTLRNTIKSAETALTVSTEQAQTALVNKTTSETLGEYFQGTLSVATLAERQSKFLIKDAEFKFMMNGLTSTIPDNSDPVAAGEIRRAKNDFERGVLSKDEAESITAENFVLLDAEDREGVFEDLEDVADKIIATSEANAFSEGRQLISRAFADVGPGGLMAELEKLTQLSDKKKDEINRQFEAEITNRDLYERAVKDKFKQMRKEGITDTVRYSSESLRILLEYKRRKNLELTELEAAVFGEQQRILINPAQAGPPTPKPVDKMTTAEKLAELRLLTR